MCRRLRNIFYFSAVLLLSATFVVSCRPDTICRQDIDVRLGVVVSWQQVDSSGGITTKTAWDSISVQGVANDSLLYANAKNVTTLWLPLRPDTSQTAYVLTWHDKCDTIFVRYDNTRRFISQACGCMVYHTLESVRCGGTIVDSVEVLNSLVETAKQENICVYVRSSAKNNIMEHNVAE